jgi:hypothetical protein
MNKVIIQWNKIYNEEIIIQNNTKLNTLLYANDQIIISNSEDNLQRGVHMLNNILKDFEIKIPCGKSKTTAFLGQQPVRSKIVIQNKILEQVNSSTILDVTYHMKVKKTSMTKSLNF